MVLRIGKTPTLAVALLVPVMFVAFASTGCGGKGDKSNEAVKEAAQAPRSAQESAQQQTEAASDTAATAEAGVVRPGSKVTIQYKGTLKDGTVFDQSKPDRPLVFVAGTGRVIPGFEKAVLGMKLNEEKTVTIPADEAYGQKNPNLVLNIARTYFPPDFNPSQGDTLMVRDRLGRAHRGVLVGASADSLLIDFNHPLAGKDLTFEIKVVGIQ